MITKFRLEYKEFILIRGIIGKLALSYGSFSLPCCSFKVRVTCFMCAWAHIPRYEIQKNHENSSEISILVDRGIAVGPALMDPCHSQ